MMLQFADSTLPVGSYAHSFGLEGLCQGGFLRSEADLKKFLERDVSASLLQVDLPVMDLAFEVSSAGVMHEVKKVDQLAWAMRPTAQLREAAGRIGRQTWQLYTKTWRTEDREVPFPYHQAPVVNGVIFSEQGANLQAAQYALCYQTFSALVQSALKLLPIGPTAAQSLLYGALSHLDLSQVAERPGSFNPLWDISASLHERADARLFIS